MQLHSLGPQPDDYNYDPKFAVFCLASLEPGSVVALAAAFKLSRQQGMSMRIPNLDRACLGDPATFNKERSSLDPV